jgi:signal transduction histidine kinase
LWLGGNLGLHRFDPDTNQFTIYNHKPEDPKSLSDNRVNSVFFDSTGTMWVGTQNGLDKFDPKTRTFTVYKERDGMSGNVVSCILEDQRGLLWMSTNKGVASFEPRIAKFSNYTVADGLPGPDLTGWGACFKSISGEMFFGGFSGVTSFFPDKVLADSVVADAFVPPIALTDFRLFGIRADLASDSPLKKAINYTDTITLSHSQNVFSIEFSALSYFNAAANRYRYKLDGLDQKWNEVGSDQRVARYTTLPAGTYAFHVQGATSRGPWSEPGAVLHIQILPAWWATWWFRTTYIFLLLTVGLVAYYSRMHRIAQIMSARFDERLAERTRMARELHDTLLQTIQGSKLVADHAVDPSTSIAGVRRSLEQLSVSLGRATQEGRAALDSLRTSNSQRHDLAEAFEQTIEECHTRSPIKAALSTVGDVRDMHPVVRDEILSIGSEAIRNACAHSHGSRVEVQITYAHDLTVRVKDDGVGIDPSVVDHGKDGHYGLEGMRERAARIGGKLTVVTPQRRHGSYDYRPRTYCLPKGERNFNGEGQEGFQVTYLMIDGV